MFLHHFLDAAGSGRPAKTARACDGRSYRHDEIEAAIRVSTAPPQRSVSCGDRVTIFMDRGAETVVALSAAYLRACPVVVERLSERCVPGRGLQGTAVAWRAQGGR